MSCYHEKAEPVSVDDEVVAQVCVKCFEQLPAAWGCEDCEWVELPRLFSETTPRLAQGQPCRRHA